MTHALGHYLNREQVLLETKKRFHEFYEALCTEDSYPLEKWEDLQMWKCLLQVADEEEASDKK